ncbi:hypothetical protein TWF694_007357 [Orbilia ellipsospora]|uniref:F-box domain-containing protein n=1 Tax=Orbilia ellipsospora TaxID=2528407 RepID=A0AAV9XJ46_9PEZI
MPLGTCPTEILHQIFTYCSNADLYRLSLVSKKFEKIAQTCDREYIFVVDNFKFPSWKLVRSLLQNQENGKAITEISVLWERRDLGDPTDIKRCAGRWTWEKEEISGIQEICKQWGLTDGTEKAILDGMNSEALIPLLLCLTPRLRNLDLGAVVPFSYLLPYAQIDYHEELEEFYYAVKKAIPDLGLDELTPDTPEVYFKDCGPESDNDEDSDTPWWDGTDSWGEYCQYKYELFKDALEEKGINITFLNDTWWFCDNIHRRDKWLPGLASLKTLKIGLRQYPNSIFDYSDSKSTLRKDGLAKLLFLPNIHTFTIQGWILDANDIAKIRELEQFRGRKSPMKTLNIRGFHWLLEDFIATADITDKVENLAILVKDDVAYEVVSRAFQKNNPKILGNKIRLRRMKGPPMC